MSCAERLVVRGSMLSVTATFGPTGRVAALYTGRKCGRSIIVVASFEYDRFDLQTVFDPILPTVVHQCVPHSLIDNYSDEYIYQ